MVLVVEHEPAVSGYEPVPLRAWSEVNAGPGAGAEPGSAAVVLRRRSPRRSKRAVVYLHCPGDLAVAGEVADWFTGRGFRFYLADVGAAATAEHAAAARLLADCFSCLDAVSRYLRGPGSSDPVVICAHGAGALAAALWCHARRHSRPVSALVLASPAFGALPGRRAGGRGAGSHGAGSHGAGASAQALGLVAAAQRRLRRGLEITCPVLVMCPGTGWDVPGGPGGLLSWALPGRRVTPRLGEHVTWLRVDGWLPGQPWLAGEPARRFFDQLSRWLGAYLSAQVRDQLL
jgi:hypothetical protein